MPVRFFPPPHTENLSLRGEHLQNNICWLGNPLYGVGSCNLHSIDTGLGLALSFPWCEFCKKISSLHKYLCAQAGKFKGVIDVLYPSKA